MSKVVFLLKSNLHFRNFVLTNIVEDVSKSNCEVFIITPERLFNEPALEKYCNKVVMERFAPTNWANKIRSHYTRASVVTRRSFNSTYRYKWENLRSSRFFLSALIYFLFSLIFDLEKLCQKIESKIPLNDRVLNFLKENKIDRIIIPTLIYEREDIDFIRAGKALGVETIQVILSWDNMTSKGFFPVGADKILVWGEEDRKNAIEEHNISSHKIIVTGPPHFDHYFTQEKETSLKYLMSKGADLEKKIVLFAGTTFNKHASEGAILKKLATDFKGSDYLFWYRPHPRAFDQSVLDELVGFENVIIDDTISSKMNKNNYSYEVGSSGLDIYPALLNTCVGVVTVFSTMSLEFTLMNKAAVNINFSARKNLVGDIEAAKGAHLKPLVSLDNFYIAKSYEELKEFFKNNIFDKKYMVAQKASQLANCLDGKGKERIVQEIL